MADNTGRTAEDENKNLENLDVDDDNERKDPLGFLPLDGKAKQIANWIAVIIGVWVCSTAWA